VDGLYIAIVFIEKMTFFDLAGKQYTIKFSFPSFYLIEVGNTERIIPE
jgi:hypothetical protein